MKNYILTLITFLTFVINFNAQDRKESREKIKALKIAYLTEQLNLTANEAEKFWPVYNAHEEKRAVLRKKMFDNLKDKYKDINNVSEAEAQDLLDLKGSIDEKEYNEKKFFIKELSKIISAKKIIKFYFADKEFGRTLMRKYRKRQKKSKE